MGEKRSRAVSAGGKAVGSGWGVPLFLRPAVARFAFDRRPLPVGAGDSAVHRWFLCRWYIVDLSLEVCRARPPPQSVQHAPVTQALGPAWLCSPGHGVSAGGK